MFLRAYTPTSVFIVGDAPKDCSAALYVRNLDLCFTISSAASFVVDQNFILKKCGSGGWGGGVRLCGQGGSKMAPKFADVLYKRPLRLFGEVNYAFIAKWQFCSILAVFHLSICISTNVKL